MVGVINEMLDRLEKDFQNQQRFVADVSHELRTPLAVLLGEVEDVRRQGNLDGRTTRFLNTVEEESRGLLRTVESFLTLSRARAGQRRPHLVPLSVEDVVLSAIRKCLPEAKLRAVRLVPCFDGADGGQEPVVLGELELLCSAVENLVHNAVRYSPQGEAVEVEVTSLDAHVDITVRDRGPGIPQEKVDTLFEIFEQARPAGKPSGSAGVGLSIANTVSELHGGAISVTNRCEGGCEFCIRLPAATREPDGDRTRVNNL
jgi:signal transduction histidine kinase